MLERLASFSFRRRRLVLLTWLLAAVAIVIAAGSLGGEYASGGRLSGTDSDAAYQLLRREFPTVEATLHFASHTLGAMPRGVADALARYARVWTMRGIRAWEEGWFALPTEVADLIAGIIHGAPGSVSMHENVTVILHQQVF